MKRELSVYLLVVFLFSLLLAVSSCQRQPAGQIDLQRTIQGVDKSIEQKEHRAEPVSDVSEALSDTVYVTHTGKCYHQGFCSSLSRSKIPMSLAEAKDKGFRPCSRCHPPE